MDENILDNEEIVATDDTVVEESVEVSEEPGTDSGQSSVSDTGSTGDTTSSSSTVIYAMEYDEELGGYPVVIVNDISEDYGVSTLSLADTTASGYQVTEYWLNYFRGVLQKCHGEDYVVFATRDSSSNYNYITHYWMYVGDIENGGEVTVYDCYAENSVYFVDISSETISAIDVNSYDTLIYSNLGNVSDIREGGGYVGETALLFFLGFFAVYAVCHNFFDNIMRRIYRK